MKQVLCKLLDNAIKYSPPYSTVVVGAKLEKTDRNKLGWPFWNLDVSVKDQGPGISADIIQQISQRCSDLFRTNT